MATDVIQESSSDQPSEAPASGRVVQDIFSTDEIFKRIHATADEEFSRSARLLFLSGLAAGLIMSFSFLGPAALAGALGEMPTGSTGLVAKLLYPLGFVFIVLGRYQLFTENTLTPVTLVLTRVASIPMLLRIWGIVLSANLLGNALAALFLAKTGVFNPGGEAAALYLGIHLTEMAWGTVLAKGIIAGWLVAGMVWLNHAARSVTGRMLIVFLLMYTVSATDQAHCIVGSVEVLFLVFKGEATFITYLWDFFAPAALGNTIGGVLLVAILNYAQTPDKYFPDARPLSWSDWLLRMSGCRHSGGANYATSSSS
jgi:formate/nitrite transporter FocA (FNT family)